MAALARVPRHGTIDPDLLAGLVALASLGAITQKVRDQVFNDTEIRIGNLMPYSGALEIFGQIGRAEAAYFDTINERGGINGRKIRFMSYDDLSDAANAMDLTRILVETDNVLLMFGSFGTPAQSARCGNISTNARSPSSLLPPAIST